MKLALGLSVAFQVLLSCQATQWRDIKSPMDTPHYQEIVRKMFPELNDLEPPTLTGRITNGTPAQRGQFPYQIFMYSFNPIGAGFLCGGSIIHRKWILTAAHCLQSKVKLEVYLGAINRCSNCVGAYIKAIIVTNQRSIIQHEQYNENGFRNDIGLVELPEEAPIDLQYIGLISLPKGSDLNRNLDGVIGTVSGFGKTSDASNDANAVLYFIQSSVMPNSVCAQTFQNVIASNICLVSTNRRSACSGDSGGPLTVLGLNGSPIQVGIVSYGAAAGCEKGYPQVFARVTSFINWIETTTKVSFS